LREGASPKRTWSIRFSDFSRRFSSRSQLAGLITGGDGPLQEQQSLLTSRLGTHHHGPNHESDGSS